MGLFRIVFEVWVYVSFGRITQSHIFNRAFTTRRYA